MNETKKPGARLLAVSRSVRSGVTLYDIGTDHAYLPVYLVTEGRTDTAYACDVAEGPLSSAERNIASAGLSDRIKTVLSDGLSAVTLVCPCDIVIAGMGGELIASIIDAKPEVKHPDVRLVLQPMTKTEYLRRYLAENGFEIIKEDLAEEGKIYQITACRYTGKPYKLSDTEAVIGYAPARRNDALFRKFAAAREKVYRAVAEGKRLASADTSAEDEIIAGIEAAMREKETT